MTDSNKAADFSSVLLGGWGFGRSSKALEMGGSEDAGALSERIKEYLGHTSGSYMHHRASDGRLSWALPPFFRTLDGKVDLMAFLLYDKVLMDQETFNTLVNGQQLERASHSSRFYLGEILGTKGLPVDSAAELLCSFKRGWPS